MWGYQMTKICIFCGPKMAKTEKKPHVHSHSNGGADMWNFASTCADFYSSLVCTALYGEIWCICWYIVYNIHVVRFCRFSEIWWNSVRCSEISQSWQDLVKYGEIWLDLVRLSKIWWDLLIYMVKFYEIHGDIVRLGETWWDSVRLSEIGQSWWDLMRFIEIWCELWDIVRIGEILVTFCKIQWDLMIYGEIQWDLFTFWWDSMRYGETLRFCSIWWDSIRYGEIQWDLVRLSEIRRLAILDNIKVFFKSELN